MKQSILQLGVQTNLRMMSKGCSARSSLWPARVVNYDVVAGKIYINRRVAVATFPYDFQHRRDRFSKIWEGLLNIATRIGLDFLGEGGVQCVL